MSKRKKTPRAVRKLIGSGILLIPKGRVPVVRFKNQPRAIGRRGNTSIRINPRGLPAADVPQKKSTRGAFGNPAKRIAFIAAGAKQGNEIAKQRQLKRAYADFYSTTEGSEFAKHYGRNFSDSTPFSRSGNSADESEFHDPADLPQARVYDNPIDHIEPQDIAPKLKNLTREDIELICDAFKGAFRWALDGANNKNGDSPLVSVGERCNVIVALMRPDLGKGIHTDKKLSFRFLSEFKQDVLQKTGLYFGKVFEWLRRGDRISSRGKRVYLLYYAYWPSEIDGRTLASLGGMSAITRQAMDKQANCLRDTLGGAKAMTMRADVTRDRCRVSQLAKKYDNNTRTH